MTNDEAIELATLAGMLSRAWRGDHGTPRLHAVRAFKLRKAERTLRTLAERECNGGLSERDERRVSRILESVRDLLTSYAVRVEHNEDPRGSALKLHFGPDAHSQPGNTMGGPEAGWAV